MIGVDKLFFLVGYGDFMQLPTNSAVKSVILSIASLPAHHYFQPVQ